MPKAYRSRSAVVRTVLAAIAEGPVGVTRLTATANLTHARLQEHLAEFQRGGLAAPRQDGDRTAWAITPKGLEALAELRRIERAMQDFGLDL